MEFEAFADRALLFVANLVCYFVPHCTLSLVLFHAIKYNNNNNNNMSNNNNNHITTACSTLLQVSHCRT